VWFHGNQASVKTDADVMREKLLQITETRNQLRGKAIALAQEVMSLSVWFLVYMKRRSNMCMDIH
jgi:hypothetical protein